MKPNITTRTTKTFVLTLFCLFAMLPMYAQTSANLTIIKQDFELAKIEAKKQHKMLLIDFYTTWCIPCKYLDEQLFKNTKISEQISKDFVVLQYDAEKDQPHKLTLKYHIGLYPSTVVLNENLYVVNNMYGLGGPDAELSKNYMAFLETTKKLNANGTYNKGISNQTQLPYPKFYEDYVNRVNTKNLEENLSNFWNNTPDHYGEITFLLMCYFEGGTEEMITFFCRNKPKFESIYGKADVQYVNSMIINKKMHNAFSKKDRGLFTQAMAFAKKNMLANDTTAYFLAMEQRMYMIEGNWKNASQLIEKRMKLTDFTDDALVNFCSAVSQKCDDMEALKKCTGWMKKNSASKQNYETLAIYAKLLAKTGDVQAAIPAMKKAIELGKLEKEDTRSDEDWLKKLSDKTR